MNQSRRLVLLLCGVTVLLLFLLEGAVARTNRVVLRRPEVKTTSGRFRGTFYRGRNNGSDFYAFRGIPYAAPPVGTLRYKAPKPFVPSEGICNASKDGPICLQMKNGKLVGSEDCLTLNVYTPKLPCSSSASRKAVLVYIHGGGFISGGVNFSLRGPDFLLKHDVVLVDINYRLGALGFMNLNTPSIPGNAGLKDQVAALHWVQHNIHAFCGDPQKVTVMGQSAGGKSIAYLGLTSESTGLFRGAIALSGTALDNWGYTEENVERASSLANMLRKQDNDIHTVEQTLLEANASDLTRLAWDLYQTGRPWGLAYNFFNPSRESRPHDDQPKVLPMDPDYLIRHTTVPRVPTITGVQRREGLTFLSSLTSEKYDKLRSYFPDYLNADIFKLGSDTAKELGVPVFPSNETLVNLTSLVNQEYFEDNKISLNYSTQAANILGDIRYVWPLYKTVLTDKRDSPIYAYEFNVVDEYDQFDNKNPSLNVSGSTHEDELPHIFRVAGKRQNYHGEGLAPTTLRFLTKLITDFAKNLTSTHLPPDATKHRTNPPYLYIGETIEVREKNFLDAEQRLHFWRCILDARRNSSTTSIPAQNTCLSPPQA